MAVQTQRAMGQNLSNMARSVTAAAHVAGEQIQTQGRADIAAAGKFGKRWTEGLRVEVQPRTGALINAKITVTHDIEFFNIFEDGGTIQGHPFLWIPLSYTGLSIPASVYAKTFGGLFYVQPTSGHPLLFSLKDRKPKYFGITAVNMPKKFHIKEICGEVMARFAETYAQQFKA